MTTYYVNPATGNDAADGLTWGTAWRTLLNGATFARLGQTDSDEIRIAKSPDPISIGNVTWTDNTNSLNIPALTNVVIDNAKTGWTSTAGTLTYTASFNRTTGNALQIAMSAVNGKSAHRNLGATLNLSAASRLTFWVNFGTTINYTASCPVQIDLCSDTAGDVAVVRCTLPRYVYPTNHWVPITVSADAGFDFTNATAIQSITIRTSAAVTNTIRFDNFVAARAASDATSLVLTDLISADITPRFWFHITSLGTGTVAISNEGPNDATSFPNAPYYSAVGTQTYNTIKRSCFDTALVVPATASTSAVNAINFTNIANFPETKTYIGGVNTATNIVDGETWFDGVTGWGFGITQTNQQQSSYSVANLSAVRYQDNFTLQHACNSIVVNANSIAAARFGVSFYSHTTNVSQVIANYKTCDWSFGTVTSAGGFTAKSIRFENPSDEWINIGNYVTAPPKLTVSNIRSSSASNVILCSGVNIDFINTGTMLLPNNTMVLSGTTGNSLLYPSPGTYTFNHILAGNILGIYGEWHRGGGPIGVPTRININGRLEGKTATVVLFSSRPVSGDTIITFGPNSLVASALTTGTPITLGNAANNTGTTRIVDMKVNNIARFSAGIANPRVFLQNFQNEGISRYLSGVNSGWSPTLDHGWKTVTDFTYAGSSAWRLLTSANTAADLPLGTIAVKGGSQVTITIRVHRSAATAVVNLLAYTQNAAPIAPVTATSTGVWELLTITYTPTRNDLVNLVIGAAPSATGTLVYVDDLQITQA